MKRLALLLPLFALSFGCQKAMDKIADDAKPGADEKAKIVPKGTGNLSGGKGDVVQDVRGAAARSVNDHYLEQLRIIIFAEMTLDPDQKVPSAAQINEVVKKDGKIVAMIKDEIVILTDTKKNDGIWAYTKWPQRGGKHYVLTAVGREEKTPTELAEALKAQGTEAKLEK